MLSENCDAVLFKLVQPIPISCDRLVPSLELDVALILFVLGHGNPEVVVNRHLIQWDQRPPPERMP